MTVTTEEVTRAAPDIICVRVHDEDFTKYPLVKLGAVDASHPTTSWVQRTNPHTDALEYCRVVGDGTWLRFGVKVPTNFLDRDEADDYTNYPSLGGVAPVAVYRKSYPHHQGESSTGGTTKSINCRHELFIEYAGTVPDGTYTMSVTGSFFPSKEFIVEDKTIRSDTIRATQVGHKPTDPEKIANLAVWIPGKGSHGRVDLDTDYSVTSDNFYIINEAGDTVFTGTPTLKIGPTTQEGASGSEIDLTWYPSTTTAFKNCTSAATKGNPTVFNMTAHGFTSGQRKWFSGFSGLDSLFNEISYEITVVDANSFSVAVDTTSASNHSFEAFGTIGYDSRVYEAVQGNRGNTYIYDLDYSSFVPTTGNFGKHYVYVPGFGVSHPFTVDPAIRFEIIKNSVKGYQSQCWGMSLSEGQAGWNRPGQFRDGKNGQNVYASTLPGCFDNAGGYYNTIRTIGVPVEWRTSNHVTDWFGAFSDAGDHDFHLYRHVYALYQLLDMGFEYVTTGTNDLHFGFPKSSQSIDKELYGEIDGLADVIHMVIWYLEPFRRAQHVDGWVYSGCQYGIFTSSSNGEEVAEFEPTWISQVDMYLLAADHRANYYYAWVAAKLGRILKDEGYTTLGNLWIDSAEDAWDWAEAIWQDWDTDGISSTGAWRDWYITELDIKNTGSLSDADITTCFNAQNAACNDKSSQTRGIRLSAATTLWRAKGGTDDAYNTIIKAAGFIQKSGQDNYSLWEYVNGPDLADNSTVRTNLLSDIDTRAATLFGGHVTDDFCYKNIAGVEDNEDLQPRSAAHEVFWAWEKELPAGDFAKWIKLLCAAEDYVLGRNQQGMTLTTGLGANPPDPILHRDQEWAGLGPTPGFTIYYRGGPVGLVRIANLSGESTLAYVVAYPSTTDGVTQTFYPVHTAYPQHEQHIRNTFCIYETEFVTQEQIVGRILNNIVLHTWDNTGTTELVDAPVTASIKL